MKKQINILLLLLVVVGSVQTASANWFGKNNRWGSGYGGWGSNDCIDWPEWTPMYWMEKMSDDDKPDCDDLRNAYFNRYRFQAAYPPAGAGLYPGSSYGLNPVNRFPVNRGVYPPLPGRIGRYGSAVPPFSYGQFPAFGATPGFAGRPFAPPYASSPFAAMGGLGYPGISPMTSFSPASPFSPMSPIGGFGSPMSPMGGFGSPMSPWSMGSPMGSGMGFPGMSPLSGGLGAPWSSFGGSPYGGSGFSPFR